MPIHYGVTTKSYKLIRYPAPIDEWELYDLSKDVGEERNVLKKHPKLAADLSKKIKDWLGQKHPTWKPKFPLSQKDGKPVYPRFL